MCMPCSSQVFCAQALWPGTKLGRWSGALKITFSESAGISSMSVLSYMGKYGFLLSLPLKVKPVSRFLKVKPVSPFIAFFWVGHLIWSPLATFKVLPTCMWLHLGPEMSTSWGWWHIQVSHFKGLEPDFFGKYNFLWCTLAVLQILSPWYLELYMDKSLLKAEAAIIWAFHFFIFTMKFYSLVT